MMQLFAGRVGPEAAYVYARPWPGPPRDDWPRVESAELRGPFLAGAQTLTARHPFTSAGPGDWPLFRTTVPDPCLWTPDRPARYEARFRLQSTDGPIEQQCWFGLPSIGMADGRLYRAGRPFWFEAVDAGWPGARESCPGTDTALWLPPPDREGCRQASESGCMLCVDLRTSRIDPDAVAQLASWPCVVALVLPAASSAADLREAAPHTLIISESPGGDGAAPPGEPDAVLCRVSPTDSIHDIMAAVSTAGCPVVFQVDRSRDAARERWPVAPDSGPPSERMRSLGIGWCLQAGGSSPSTSAAGENS